MKVFPITNGTPDNSLEFYCDDFKAAAVMSEVIGSGARVINEENSFIPMPYRYLVYGEAFKELVRKAGPMKVKTTSILIDEDERAVFCERPRTAAELCAWIEGEVEDLFRSL